MTGIFQSLVEDEHTNFRNKLCARTRMEYSEQKKYIDKALDFGR